MKRESTASITINSTVSIYQYDILMFFVSKLLNFGVGSIMMDADSTKARNEIMRRIKLYQMKERNMPNFIRKKREEMLAKVRIFCLEFIKVFSFASL
jgi:hypothetical protein